MSSNPSQSVTRELRPQLAAPVFPGNSSEFITLIAHYYRAEIARMAGWRDRIDRTTNWAITVVGAMLSISLSTPTAHHGVVIFAMLLVTLLLIIESRRYRFFDIYRARVRRLERHYFAQVFSPQAKVDVEWTASLAEDLRRPNFLIGFEEAIGRRLRRNYFWMFLMLLLAWLLKITSAKLQPGAGQDEMGFSFFDWVGNAAIGPIPGWIVIAGVALFYGWLLFMVLRTYEGEVELTHGQAHV
jgi:uncharacterized membrane protein